MEKNLENNMNKPLVVCELIPHPEGHWNINGKSYRPEWPRGWNVDKALNLFKTDRDYKLFATTLIETGINFMDKKDSSPKNVKISLDNSYKIKVFVDGQEQKQYLN